VYGRSWTSLPTHFISARRLYERTLLWDHRRIYDPSLTETSLCGAYLYLVVRTQHSVWFWNFRHSARSKHYSNTFMDFSYEAKWPSVWNAATVEQWGGWSLVLIDLVSPSNVYGCYLIGSMTSVTMSLRIVLVTWSLGRPTLTVVRFTSLRRNVKVSRNYIVLSLFEICGRLWISLHVNTR